MNKIKDTKLGAWLKKEAPEVLHVVGDLLPESGVLGVVKNILGDKIEKNAEATAYMQELEMARLEAVSARWSADMGSDSQLSKNVRPMTLILLLVMMFSLAVVDSVQSVGFEVKPQYIDLIQILSLTAFGAYFAGRTIEKSKS